MVAASLITLRETLEASLVVGIMLAFLSHTGNRHHKKYVWLGVVAGALCSLALAFVFHMVLGGFTEISENIYEGVTMFVAAGLLTWMILWMIVQGRSMKRHIESEVAEHVENNHALGIFLLSFISTSREGVETVIFLRAAFLNAQVGAHFVGALFGIGIALLLAYCMFKGFSVIPLRQFFTVTSVLLLLFGAGLVAHGIHEFQEAGFLPGIIDQVWDLNPPMLANGAFPLLHEQGAIGELLKSIFGYNGNPSLLEVLGYVTYIGAIAVLWRKMTRRKAYVT